MIGYLKGTVLESHENPILLNVGNVGYSVYVPEPYLSALTKNKEQQFYVHPVIKEDSFDLYGFYSKEELNIFRMLLSISGIGPKIALAIVAKGTSPVKEAVYSADISFFSDVPRLGKKNAQKIIIELKSKLGGGADINLRDDMSQESKDAIDALQSMGFSAKESLSAIRSLPAHAQTLEDKIKEALKTLSKRV